MAPLNVLPESLGMSWKGKLLVCAYSVAVFFAQAEEVEIGLFYSEEVMQWEVKVHEGSLSLEKDGYPLAVLEQGQQVWVSREGNRFRVFNDFRDFGASARFAFIAEQEGSLYAIRTSNPRGTPRWLNGKLRFRDHAVSPVLATLDLEDYVAGVVQAESGVEQGIEYYKVQAVICRTFLLSNRDKHSREGFNLCDKVHCQVFHGLSKGYRAIAEGVRQTQDMVMVDRHLKPIETVFHSNCGGHTLNSEDYWQQPIAYLKGVPDRECKFEPHATWQLRMNKDQWLGYLKRRFGFAVEDSLWRLQALQYNPKIRSKYFLDESLNIPLRTIRSDWNLRSTYFAVDTLPGEKIILRGRGFGHGVGLCQEGAMVRARTGQSYIDILHHFYKNVYLVDRQLLPMYRKRFLPQTEFVTP